MPGQAPGERQGQFGRPFAWTEARTLFGWYRKKGVVEETFRERVHVAAVYRCFPEKNLPGGDLVPRKEEIERCAVWLTDEADLLQPELLIPLGKPAIRQSMPANLPRDIVGRQRVIEIGSRVVDVIPSTRPSGLSTWQRVEPGKGLLQDAQQFIRQHVVWKRMLAAC